MGIRWRYLGILVFVLCTIHIGLAATINVGPGQTYTTISSGVTAASSGDVVIVSAGTYSISSPIMMKSGVTVQGAGIGKSIIYVPSWTGFASMSEPGYVYFSGVSNAVLYNFTIRGPATSISDQSSHSPPDYANSIFFRSSSYCTVHDIFFELGAADCIKSSDGTCSHITIYNCRGNSNHDFVQIWSGQYWNVSNCEMTLLHNSGVRFAGCTNSIFQYSTVTAYQNLTSGYVGVEIENPGNSVTIDHCIFHDITTYSGKAGVLGLVYDNENGQGTATVSNNIFWNCPGGYIVPNYVTVTDTGNTKGTTNTNVSYWVSQGYGFDISKMGGGSTGGSGGTPAVVYNGSVQPSLTTPVNHSTVTRINQKVNFVWTDLNSTSYGIGIYNNSSRLFPSQYVTGANTTSPGISLPLADGHYWVGLSAHDDVHNTLIYNTAEDPEFTVSGDFNATSGVYGIISDSTTGNPIEGAVVTLWNGTWSATYVTGPDGAYQFSVASGSGTYYLQAAATLYQSSTDLPITVYGDYNAENIALVKSPSYFQPHYCNIYVYKGIIGGPIKDALVKVYTVGNNYTTGTPDMQANTSSGGEVSFAFTQDQQYTVVVDYGSEVVVEIVSGNHDNYVIFLSGEGEFNILPEQFDEYVNITVSPEVFDDSSAYVNVNYTDSVNQTQNVQFFLGETDENGTFISNASSDVFSGVGNINYSFPVSDYLGKTYTVQAVVTHTAFGTVTKTYPVKFPGSNIPFLDNIMIAWLAMFVVFTIASVFSVGEHASGSVIVCMITWFFWILGCFQSFGTQWNWYIFAGLSVASANALMALFNDVRDSGV